MTPPRAAVGDAAAAALAGRLIVLATDTVAGIGTRPDDPAATARLFEAKGRPAALALPVLVPSASAAAEIGELGSRAAAIAYRVWPGAITLVVRRAPASRAWQLGGDGSTVGIRVPRHELARSVLELTGPLAVTSANRSGDPTPRTCDELRRIFRDLVDVYLCDEGGTGRASTVLDLTSEPPRVLRRGDLDDEALARVLAE